MSSPIKISSLDLKLNAKVLDIRMDFLQLGEGQPFLLCRQNPIKIERELILDSEDNHIGFIMLNEIGLDLMPNSNKNLLRFSISPYLAPTPNLIETVAVRIKRLPPPILCQVEPLPHKIKLNIGSTKS